MFERIAIIILNYNDSDHVESLIAKIKEYKIIYKIVVVDNCSSDNSYNNLKNISDEKVNVIISERNGGYGYGNNYGVKYAKKMWDCKYALIVNPDVEFSEKTIEKLYFAMIQIPDCAVSSCKQVNSNVQNTKSAWRLPHTLWSYVFNSEKVLKKFTADLYYKDDYLMQNPIVEVDCVQGAMLLVEIENFLSFGGYDEHVFLYCEETNLGFDLRKNGFKTIYVNGCEYYHYHSQSISKSFPKIAKQQAMILASKKKVISKNWELNYVKNLIIDIIFKISIFEMAIIGKVKEKKNDRNG